MPSVLLREREEVTRMVEIRIDTVMWRFLMKIRLQRAPVAGRHSRRPRSRR
jgi:hypothetical protein